MDILANLAKQLETLAEESRKQLLDIDIEIDNIKDEKARAFLRESLVKARTGKLCSSEFKKGVEKLGQWA
jgi:hypothetical protein